ncbi:hydrolase 2, exosortase A system-associated [Polaromonas sp. C04]|nr:hydrolase 2, exosortase A system-associated [Polaromonas sp. C04]
MPAGSAPSTPNDQRFCIFYPAKVSPGSGAARGLVLYIHPFAEEMNKARRMAALQARALAQAGYAVLQIDLLGCGDSSGDFGDASWQDWVNDVLKGCRWLRRYGNAPGADSGQMPLWLWGLRAGCLLAVEAARQLGEPCNFLFWQPPATGKPLLRQFLRLKAAGDMLGSQGKGIMADMRQQLSSGASVEVAGYRLSPGLAAGLEQATLRPPAHLAPAQRVEWLELSTREDASLSPVSAQTLGDWQQAGYIARSHIVRGPAFWQTTEIEDAPALIPATTAALSGLSA